LKLASLYQPALIAGVAILAMAAGASASTLTFNTNSPGTQFVSPNTGLTLANSSGAAATLVFTPDANSVVGVPTNINYGLFTLTCSTCTTLAGGIGSVFSAFTFDLVITDLTDNATGLFVGTSTGGNVYQDQSQITIHWVPGSLGPGTTGATLGNFGSTSFDINTTTRVVEPGSGHYIGVTTVQGDVVGTPEPATFGMIGGSLIGLGLLRRKIATRT